jgi:DNA-binding transcriptional regulator YhcF (GntR family)
VVATRRGLGNFVNEGARESVLRIRRKEFFEEQVPEFFRTMKALGVTLEEIVSYIKNK